MREELTRLRGRVIVKMVGYSVNWVSKKKMPNYFGYFDIYISDSQKNRFPKKAKIFVRKDLPKIIREFVLQHEKGHLWYINNFKGSVRMPTYVHEIMANLYGITKLPLGFIPTGIWVVFGRVNKFFRKLG